MSSTCRISIRPPIHRLPSSNTLTNTAIFQSGVATINGEMASQLAAGALSFTVPFWKDPADGSEADITSDDPAVLSTPLKLTAGKQIIPVVRKIDIAGHRFVKADWRRFRPTNAVSRYQ